MATLLEARIVLRDSARITACTATQLGGGVYGQGTITVAGDAVISQCSVLLQNTGEGGGIFGDTGTIVELRDRAKVVQCQVQGAGGCILASDILISDRAHVGHCSALNSLEVGFGGCLIALSRIVVTDFATVTYCYADDSSAFFFAQTGTLLLAGNALVSDCTALWSGAVMVANSNTSVVLQDNATITRAYSGHDGTFFLLNGASLLMTGRASIRDCVSDFGSAVYADQSTVAIYGQNQIVNCSGDPCSSPVSLRVAQYRRQERPVGSISVIERPSWQTGYLSKVPWRSPLLGASL